MTAGFDFQLIGVGRHKATYVVRVGTARALLKEVRRHLLSSDVSIVDGFVVVGGARPAGRVRGMNDLAEAALRRWEGGHP
jgi:hypothetical protein